MSRNKFKIKLLSVALMITLVGACGKKDLEHQLANIDGVPEAKYSLIEPNPNAKPEDCFYSNGTAYSTDFPENAIGEGKRIGAVGIHIASSGAIIAYYPTDEGQKELNVVKTEEELIAVFAKRNRREIMTELFDINDGRGYYFYKDDKPSPLDFDVEMNSVTAFYLMPSAWSFHGKAFVLDNSESNKPVDMISPFNDDVKKQILPNDKRPKLALVYYNINDHVTKTGCKYKYNLPVLITSFKDDYETKIVIDPGIGNNGGPPGGP